MAAPPAKVMVLMVPLPAQGHLNQLLHLARLISDRGVPVHFAAPATHNRQARLRVQGWDTQAAAASSSIQFHDLPFPAVPTPPPEPDNPNKYPAHLQPLFDAAEPTLRHPLAALIRSLAASTHRLAVIHDALMSFVAEDVAAFASNAKAYIFAASSAFNSFASFADYGPAIILTPAQQQEFSSLGAHSALSITGCFTDEFRQFLMKQLPYMQHNSGVVYNSSRSIEGKYLDLLCHSPAFRVNRTQWAVGPFNSTDIRAHKGPRASHPCMEWLDLQPPESVLYVSFGTMTSISDEQAHELAMGLKRSRLKFLWVLREADRGDIFAEDGCGRKWNKVGEEYEDEVKGVGMVVRDWAPQMEILAHEAVGGFMSHCGWNSCMESLSMGVPIAAWPMHSDQPRNSVLLTEILRVGVLVRDWAQWDKVVRAEEVEVAAKRLLGGEEGKAMRERARCIGADLRGAHGEGGVSRADLDSFLAHVST